MANKERGERKVVFVDGDGDQKTYTLKFTTNAICNMEDILEMESGEIDQKMRLGSMRILRTMLYCGLQDMHKMQVRTTDQAGVLMNQIDDMDEFIKALTEAYQAGMPGYKEPETEPESENGSPKATKGKKLQDVSAGSSS